jgi:L-threonylcarbamoyladenylate synthase
MPIHRPIGPEPIFLFRRKRMIHAMETKVYRVNSKRPAPKAITESSNIIRLGGLVAFPTETVYGLGADALNPKAVRGIYKAKGRPQDNPMIVHVATIKDAKKLAKVFPPKARLLCDRFWPGPLTIILPKAKNVPRETTAGLDTVAIRMPAHRVALELIRKSKTPIAAPSANSSGKPSPTNASHVKADLMGKIHAILDAGPTRIGVESTVIDLTTKTPTILRPGGITIEQLRKVMPDVVTHQPAKEEKRPRSPGMKYRHYAPKAKVILVEGPKEGMRKRMKEKVRHYVSAGMRVGVISTERREYWRPAIAKLAGKTSGEYANRLFRLMRELDQEGVDVIIAEGAEEREIGRALMNRLRKAATKTIKA